MAVREIVYDTETTGMRYQDGHRVIEIAGVEIIDGVITGRTFHALVNPERSIPDDVVKVHGITDAHVADAPTFRSVLPKMLEFFRGARLIAHNSDFDERFLNNEMQLCGHPESFWSIAADTEDTVQLSRRIWLPEKDEQGKTKRVSHTLDAILDRCQIDRSDRTLHGALIDSQLLAKAYLWMKAERAKQGPTVEDDVPRSPVVKMTAPPSLPAVPVDPAIQQAHDAFMASIRPTPSAAPKP